MTTTLHTLSGAPIGGFAFGCMQFGGKADAAASRTMFEACLEAGIAHFDTAFAYTGGTAERLLGGFAKSEREACFIATKAGYTGGAGRANILAQFDQSRARLGMDMVDLLYIHRWDGDTALEETFETLAELQQNGLTRYIGVSNFAAWQVMKAQTVATRLGTRINVIQPMYNLVKRQAEVELLPMCQSEGILPVPYSPLGGGLLTGKYGAGGAGRISEDNRYATRYGEAFMHTAAKGLSALAAELGTDPATLAVAWVAAHPSTPVPILSASAPDQLASSLAGMQYQMTPELYARISALSPTPPPATDRLEEASA
ncbi:MAG: aldo/keto reductase [Paracoccaceae bacterium]|nr:aldo/keto reductase [Paracoccaceae bacterium]